MQKTLMWVLVFLGSTIGGYIPMLWGAGLFSFSSVLCGALGAIAGIWLTYKISQRYF